MDTQFRSQVVFHLTGRRPAAEAPSETVGGLRPALLAEYRHLDELRYDFPVVLATSGDDYVRSLSAVVDAVLRDLAPQGVEGEGMRRRVLKVEREIRRQVTAGARGTLSELWDAAVRALANGADEALARDAGLVRQALPVDGELAGCDATLPARFLRHAWSTVQRVKARSAAERIGSLVIRLGDILRADHLRSPQALQKTALEASFGAAHRGLFDFNAMSRLLQRVGPHGGLSEQRRRRVEQTLATLKSQRFFPAAKPLPDAEPCYGFEFDDAAKALEAFRARLPELVALLRALQIAELEVVGGYIEDVHDPVFAALDEQSVTPEDLQFFPDYLACVSRREDGEPAQLAGALSAGVPLKLLVQVDDLLEESSPGRGQFAFGVRGAQLATTAMSLDDVFVLQTAASNLLKMRDRVRQGLAYAGPALFSMYAGRAVDGLPAYLNAAAAMQARAFPVFSFDPAAGADLDSRFSLENNPQPERDWPVDAFRYADQDLQSVTEEVAFSFVDYVASDPRHAAHFAPVPRAAWADGMLPARDWLEQPPRDPASGVPYILAVDDADTLCRLVVDERLMREALRCRDGWRRLQELGGIRDARTERRLAQERQAWEEQRRRELEAAESSAASAPAAEVASTEPAPAPAATAEVVEPERNPDEPYIETIRCSTCNECTQVNPRMFKYNDNKQAYIADLKAGTYADLVQAAESCQLSIIHPGKPWNPDEPGLPELIERAQPFQ
jgi:ferredoxin